jgi:esterase/lipase
MAKFLTSSSDRVTLLIHGYKSSPYEMFELAKEINNSNISCYCVRMDGHGTSPFDMATTTRKQWEESCEIAYKILSIHFKQVDLCGFSTGGLIALKLSVKFPEIKSIVVINPALKLCDIKFRLVKIVNLWSQSLEKLSNSKKKYVTDIPFYPKTNYSINHFSCMKELSILMDEISSILPVVKVNMLIVNSSNDPVVLPKSSKEIFEKISSNIRYLEEIDSNEHVIVRGKSMKIVSEFIKKFLI